MFIKGSKDEGQVFLMIVGAGAHTEPEANRGFAQVFVSLLAIAIVAMLLQGLLNDAEKQQHDPSLPSAYPAATAIAPEPRYPDPTYSASTDRSPTYSDPANFAQPYPVARPY